MTVSRASGLYKRSGF